MQKNIGGDSFYLFISCLLTLKNPTMRVRWKQQQKKLNKNKKWLWSFAEGKFTLLSILFLYLCWEFLQAFLFHKFGLIWFASLTLLWLCTDFVKALLDEEFKHSCTWAPHSNNSFFFFLSFSFFHQIINSVNVSKFY